MNLVKDADPITYKMVLEILEDEIEHEEDLEALMGDLGHCKSGIALLTGQAKQSIEKIMSLSITN